MSRIAHCESGKQQRTKDCGCVSLSMTAAAALLSNSQVLPEQDRFPLSVILHSSLPTNYTALVIQRVKSY